MERIVLKTIQNTQKLFVNDCAYHYLSLNRSNLTSDYPKLNTLFKHSMWIYKTVKNNITIIVVYCIDSYSFDFFLCVLNVM